MLHLDNQKPTSSVQSTRPPKQNSKSSVKEDSQKIITTNNQKVYLFKNILYDFLGTLHFGKDKMPIFIIYPM